LTVCFTQVFPNLPLERIGEVSAVSYADWDSVTQLLLVGLIEEEFGIRLAIEEIASLTSFELLLDHVQRHDER